MARLADGAVGGFCAVLDGAVPADGAGELGGGGGAGGAVVAFGARSGDGRRARGGDVVASVCVEAVVEAGAAHDGVVGASGAGDLGGGASGTVLAHGAGVRVQVRPDVQSVAAVATEHARSAGPVVKLAFLVAHVRTHVPDWTSRARVRTLPRVRARRAVGRSHHPRSRALLALWARTALRGEVAEVVVRTVRAVSWGRRAFC